MSDPLDERFRDFATGTPPMNPASPAEIRDRGDRMRRRRTALTAAGAALAVALIATPVAVLATGGTDDDVQPAPGPPSTTVTDPPSDDPDQPTETTAPEGPLVSEIPPEFPLTAGYPPVNGSDGTPVEVTDTPGVTTIQACGAPVWSPDDVDAIDVAGAFYGGEAEDSRARTLVVYNSVERAEANLRDQIVAGVTACPEDGGADGSEWTVQGTQGDTTIITKQYVSGGQPVPGLEVYLVTRVANALLVDWNYGEGGASDASRDAVVRFALDQQADVVTAMGMFDLPTGDPGTENGGSTSGDLPDSVLSAADLPTRDRLTPWEPAPYPDQPVIACQPGVSFSGEFLGQRDFTARIAAGDGAPEGTDTAAEIRLAVYEYDSPDAAAAAAAAVTGWFTDCDAPAQRDPTSLTRQGDVVEGPGGQRYATWVYSAPEACSDDCDAAWFDRMGVVRSDDRIAVVSFRELGGPLEPDGLDATMVELLETLRQAVARA